MAEAVIISFRIVEPMMFRGPGEFDPFVRGTYSRAITLAMPTPSTIAGTIATYCISVLGRLVPGSGDWLNQYISVLGNDVEVRGPLIKLYKDLMAEDRLSGGFLTLEKIRQKCEKEWKRLGQKTSSLKQLDEYLEREDFEPSVKVGKSVRVGVGLETRENAPKTPMKTAKENFLYGAEYLNYIAAGVNQDKITSVEIVAEIRGEIKDLLSAQKRPVKFGGEGRVALLTTQQGAAILDEIKKRLWDGREEHHGFLALYLATPALFKSGKNIEEHLKEWVEGMNYELIGLSGESSVLGAGFMIRERKRKPIYTSINPGSILFLKGRFDLLKMYLGMVGEASMLGYGTTIPIPIA